MWYVRTLKHDSILRNVLYVLHWSDLRDEIFLFIFCVELRLEATAQRLLNSAVKCFTTSSSLIYQRQTE